MFRKFVVTFGLVGLLGLTGLVGLPDLGAPPEDYTPACVDCWTIRR